MTQKSRTESLDSLLTTMETLRAPGGCPWDAEQTPESLTPYILEEACELIDAIETGNPELIMDELGDLLLQVVFQAQIFSERGEFEFADVAAAIDAKLLRRHPHVFENSGPGPHDTDLDRQWDRIKQQEKPHQQKTGCLSEHLPNKLPGLQRAQKLIAKTTAADLPLAAALSKEIPMDDDSQLTEERLGLLLLQIAALAQRSGLDAERAVRKTVRAVIQQLPPRQKDDVSSTK